MRKKLKCLHEELGGGGYSTTELGPQVVEVARITGSVDKCRELDRRFRPLRRIARRERYRRAALARAFRGYSDSSIPPVRLYTLRGEYYVIDGHRRLAAALMARREFVDAYVTEVLEIDDRRAAQGSMSRRRFELETGLRNLRLDFEVGYSDLLGEIESRGGEGRLPEKARRWHTEVYLPAVRAIRETNLPALFGGAREGDLFVMILRFYRRFYSGFPRAGDLQRVLSAFLEERRRLGWRLRALGPVRFLRRLVRPRRPSPPAPRS